MIAGKNAPDKAFILAAGLGTRMRPYTDHCPKPMVEVNSESLIQRIIRQLAAENVHDITINLHYMADKLEQHLKNIQTPKLHLTKEKKLLNTGGGIKAGLKNFNNAPFYAINGDSFCIDAKEGNSALSRLAQYWDDEKMDILLLLQPIKYMNLTEGVGDYHLNKNGTCERALDKSGNYMFSSIRILHPRIFENTSDGEFSFLDLMDKAQKQNRLFGLPHNGEWHHISTAKDLETVNEHIKNDKKTA